MAHATTSSAPKQGRSVRLVIPLAADGTGGVLAITQNGVTTDYWIDALPNEYGDAAYHLEKQGDGKAPNDEYDVLLDRNMSTCTCPDWTYRGYKKGACKHILACHALRQAGKIS